jgi:hypothetical protein
MLFYGSSGVQPFAKPRFVKVVVPKPKFLNSPMVSRKKEKIEDAARGGSPRRKLK